MKGTINRFGEVTITFNINHEQLRAPDIEGAESHWLPCAECGEVLQCPMNVVIILCPKCTQQAEKTHRKKWIEIPGVF